MSKFVKLSSVSELTVGFVGTMAEHYEKYGVPFLRSLNIKPFKIVYDDMKYILKVALEKATIHEWSYDGEKDEFIEIVRLLLSTIK